MTNYDTRAAYAPGTPAPGDPGQAPGGSTTDQVKEQVTQGAQVARDKARGATQQASGRIRDQVDQRSTEAGERIGGTAQDVRSVAEELRRQDKETPARLAEQVADQADRVGDYLKGADGDRILRDAERFARDNPWLVAGGGLVLGFAASRVMKASSSRRYRSPDRDVRPARGFTTPVAEPYPTTPTTGVDATLDPAYPTAGTTDPGYVAPGTVTGTVPPAAYPPPDPIDQVRPADPLWPDPDRPGRRRQP